MAADRPDRPAGARRRRGVPPADASEGTARPEVLAQLREACTPPPGATEAALRPYLEAIAEMRERRPADWVADAHGILTREGIIACGRDHFRRTVAKMLAEGAGPDAASRADGGPQAEASAAPGSSQAEGSAARDAAAGGDRPGSPGPGEAVEPGGPLRPADRQPDLFDAPDDDAEEPS
ncbi:hypothetical protein [Thermaurantiacus tibetensis]|uniref:hypothetical protein n=1 Tax=Thermaurantiacus tibetensis TaxID=2759035 RepID=UPI00188DF256|nr:hypothetical protein [Thermaurantiacus tibetensis]